MAYLKVALEALCSVVRFLALAWLLVVSRPAARSLIGHHLSSSTR